MRKRSEAFRRGFLAALGLAAAAWAGAHGKKDWPAPEEAKKLKNPVEATAAALAAGKTLFVEHCAHCHGEAGKGDGPEAAMYDVKPADFTDARMMDVMTDGEVFWKVSEGRRPMPSFKKKLTEEQRWQLVSYVRTFAAKPAPAPKHTPLGENKKPAPRDCPSSRTGKPIRDIAAEVGCSPGLLHKALANGLH